MIIAVGLDGYVNLVAGERTWELRNLLVEDINEFLPWDKNEVTEKSNNGFPFRPGIYRCTIRYEFYQGYFEGYACDSESDWSIYAENVEKLDLDGCTQWLPRDSSTGEWGSPGSLGGRDDDPGGKEEDEEEKEILG